jgi:hypothetical protein
VCYTSRVSGSRGFSFIVYSITDRYNDPYTPIPLPISIVMSLPS